ncbi:MAG: RNA 2',3'-cyclic phosphodiesterase [Candidatus Kapaibacterium sp.]
MRLFIGTFADSSLFEIIYPELKDNFSESLRGKWVELENLHFTYKFLGEVNEDKASEIKDDLSPLLTEYNAFLQFRGISAFPSLSRPKVMFAGVYSEDNLVKKLHAGIDEKLYKFGFEKDKRDFTPHLTLVRIKEYSAKEFKKAAGAYKDHDFGMMPRFRISLIKSVNTSKGPVYSLLD